MNQNFNFMNTAPLGKCVNGAFQLASAGTFRAEADAGTSSQSNAHGSLYFLFL